MISVTCRRPFSELGDQQLLDQTKRLAANQRCLEVHILDHLDEIDRRGLALRRGFSSLFDYAVRELRFTVAAAQRRIQAMRLCRRHGWVRASLQSGELSMTAAAQLETTFAGAERAERQSRTAHRKVGQTRQLGLPAAPGEAGEQGERGPRSAPELAPPAGECAGDAAAVNTRVAPVASHAVAQDPGAGHAGAQLPRPELNGDAALFPAPSCNPVAVAVPVPVAVPAAPSGGGATPAPQVDTAATERQNPIAMLANAAPPSQSGPAALLDGARADGVPSGAPAAAAAPQSGPAAPLDGARGGGAPSGAPLLRRRSSRPTPWRMAPMPAPPCRARRSPLRRRSGHLVCPLTADRAARQPEQRAGPRRMASLRAQACRARRSPLRRRSRYSPCSPTADRATHQPGQRRAPSVHLRCRLIRTWPVAVDALMQGVVEVSLQRIPAASGVRTHSD